MTILALEFSSPQRSVAVVRTGNTEVAAEVVETGAGLRPGQNAWASSRQAGGTRALGMIEAVLREAGLEREQIDVIAIGLGPGSYTGIRVALSIAQGWQLARGVKLLGASSTECLAAQARLEKIFGRVNVVIDAQRNELYRVIYEISQSACREIEPLQIMGLAEIESRANAGDILIGPEATRWFPSGRIIFPHARTLGRLVAGRNDFVSGDKLAPIYLRATNFIKAPPVNPVAH
ncbi:MAG: tRNA (adenosine(37)-N6)-threonylcarbamoyltransferase complex dimerization subunit type 1 TsaB [Verrucomicrobiota bacterium]|jgi:tRNA threonylcarbamoyladenosine biosynthesis protein TsaB